uniref:Embryonic stem cell-specific 5-hydroxymethylcytosine-binding protein n=1 Tax=Peronospora matthiolae TaxID=2874970 RepID=A0AAV1ULA9_9STRA
MCGRSRCTLARQQVAEAAGVSPEEFIDGDKYKPVENMGPGRCGPVLLQCGGEKVDSETKAKTRLQAMRWGLVPSFTKANAKPDHFLMFNARYTNDNSGCARTGLLCERCCSRSESLKERPAFKRLVESKRCVVVCEGYYEWHQVDKREKQPYYFYREKSLMKFAGLYDRWKNEEGELMYTYTILTTAIASEMKWLHTRMPVILPLDEDVGRWLSGAKFEDLKGLLKPHSGSDLKWHPVDKRVGSMQFQGEECAKQINIKHAGDIKSFFGVKTEKQEPRVSSPRIPPTTSDKTDEVLSSDSVASSSVKKEEQSVDPDARLAKRCQQFPTNFVPASSLLGKSFADEKEATQPEQLNQKRRRVSSPSRPKKTSTLKSPAKFKMSPGPKQSSLDFFFSKGSAPN